MHAQQGAPPEQPPCGTASLAALLPSYVCVCTQALLDTELNGHAGMKSDAHYEGYRTAGFVVPNGGARHTSLFFAVHLHTDGPHGAMGAGEAHGWFN